MYTYRNGKRVDSTHLHMKEWLNAIRNGTKLSCGIKKGFEEAITAHMGGPSYRLDRRIDRDQARLEIVPIDGFDLDEVLLTDIEKMV